MNFVTVGTRAGAGSLSSSPELFAAVAGGLIADAGLILPNGVRLPARVEGSLRHVLVQKGMEGLDHRFAKPVSLHLSSDDPCLQAGVLDVIKPRRVTSIDTHSTWIERKLEHVMRLKDDVDVLFLNQEEARLLSGKKDPMDAARSLCNGCLAVVKLGANGCIVAGDDVLQLPAYPVKVLDDAHAGDAFAGAFIAYLSKRPSVSKAAMYGSVAASFCVEGGMDRLLCLERKDVRHRYKAYLKMF